MASAAGTAASARPAKLHGRAFYESIGSPKLVLAPMVDQSEFAWRMLTRSFMNPSTSDDAFVAYSPMLHARRFVESPRYRLHNFKPIDSELPSPPISYEQARLEAQTPHLDGHPEMDRPLIVQFCANSPDEFLEAAKYVQPYCDAVDLNLGCPQGIAKRGNYGAFLQEDWNLIYRLINKLHNELNIPVTAKMRVLETREKTLEYAKMILSAGASILTVHGRRREQKSHNTGLADWSMLRYLRDNLPPATVLFANGNILQHDDIKRCLEETGFDGVMSAEGNLFDPAIFSRPPAPDQDRSMYWRGDDGKGGYRVDAVMRRYMDIIHKYVLGHQPPSRPPLYDPELDDLDSVNNDSELSDSSENDQPPRKKSKKQDDQSITSVNLVAMQSHLFNLLRALVSTHTDIRDALAGCRVGNIDAFERVLTMVERAVRRGLKDYKQGKGPDNQTNNQEAPEQQSEIVSNDPSAYGSAAVIARCKRPWWVAQPHIRPSPEEALKKGALQLSKKDKKRLEEEKVKLQAVAPKDEVEIQSLKADAAEKMAVPTEGLVCG